MEEVSWVTLGHKVRHKMKETQMHQHTFVNIASASRSSKKKQKNTHLHLEPAPPAAKGSHRYIVAAPTQAVSVTCPSVPGSDGSSAS